MVQMCIPVDDEIWWAEWAECKKEDMLRLSNRERLHVGINKVVVVCLWHVELFEHVI
jgi:hypothetical protein